VDADLVHGGALDSVRTRFPDAPRPWIDLSTGVSPIRYPLEPVPAAALDDLPSEDLAHRARAAAARAFGAAPALTYLTPGSSAAIAALARLEEMAGAAIVSPTYSEHARAFALQGKPVRAIPEPDPAAQDAALVLVNPNNPDGRSWTRDEILAIVRCRSAAGRWTLVDEAFADFFPDHSVAGDVGPAHKLIVLRSFGKTYGLAGLRLGAVLAPPDILTRVKADLGPWPVSTPALLAACAAYPDTDWLVRTRAALATRRDQMCKLLRRSGFEIEGDGLLFVTGRRPHAHTVWTRLCKAGVYTRRFSDDVDRLRFGLPADAPAFDRLAAALSDQEMPHVR